MTELMEKIKKGDSIQELKEFGKQNPIEYDNSTFSVLIELYDRAKDEIREGDSPTYNTLKQLRNNIKLNKKGFSLPKDFIDTLIELLDRIISELDTLSNNH